MNSCWPSVLAFGERNIPHRKKKKKKLGAVTWATPDKEIALAMAAAAADFNKN